jgi:hypothetical protein
MGIGGRDYSHRSVQRSSLRELSEGGGGEAALDKLPASPRPPEAGRFALEPIFSVPSTARTHAP